MPDLPSRHTDKKCPKLLFSISTKRTNIISLNGDKNVAQIIITILILFFFLKRSKKFNLRITLFHWQEIPQDINRTKMLPIHFAAHYKECVLLFLSESITLLFSDAPFLQAR